MGLPEPPMRQPERERGRYSYLSHLECSLCGQRHDADAVHSVCDCGSPLLARYDLPGVGSALAPADFAQRPANMWRYHELLPIRSQDSIVSFGEPMTPLISLEGLGKRFGLERLLMKDEGMCVTGTFKARGAAVGVSRAKELGVSRIAMPTNGNAGAAWAGYGARAGIESLIVMPVSAPAITKAECALAGARLFLVDGLISDAGRIVAEAISAQGYADASTFREPYRLEGKKTMGYELFEQLGWRVPDVIVYPTGGGVGLIGIHKAMLECRQLGWLGPKVPRFVAVQAAGCAPVVHAFELGESRCELWQDASTIAFGITVPKPFADFLILDALYSTGGAALAVEDALILNAQARVAAAEGIFICPEGAACVAAVQRLRSQGWIDASEEVVIINTGAGIKYPEAVSVHPPVLSPGDKVPQP